MPGTALPHFEQQLPVRLLSTVQRFAGGRARGRRFRPTERVRGGSVQVVRDFGNAASQILLSGHELGGCLGR